VTALARQRMATLLYSHLKLNGAGQIAGTGLHKELTLRSVPTAPT